MFDLFRRIKKALGIWVYYYIKPNATKFGHFGKEAALAVPADLKKPSNIYLYDHARIGPRSTIMTVGNSKFIMKSHSGAAEGLVVITSNHNPSIGHYRTGGNEDNVYRDVVVEEDVWLGANVTLLAGSVIGRGSFVGAGSVCRSKFPPYSIVIGNPAKVVGFRFSPEESLEHERCLYPENNRLPLETLQRNYEKYYLKRTLEIAKYIKI